MEYILRTHNLTKDFKKFSAVSNLNMNIKQGEIYGFLGKMVQENYNYKNDYGTYESNFWRNRVVF